MEYPIPKIANIGSGARFNKAFLNVDIDKSRHPDIVADITASNLFSEPRTTKRFGEITIQRGYFDEVIASEVLEHISDLSAAMKNCLDMLRVGGVMKIVVPYDLSLGAWQDPTHVRAFNENSWKYYTEWFWYMGWDEARFQLTSLKFALSSYGASMANKGAGKEDLLRTPRAVDHMHVILKKLNLTEKEIEYSRTKFSGGAL